MAEASDSFERLYVRPKPGRVLIVGSQVYAGREDRRLRHSVSIGIDMLAGPGVDRVVDLEKPLPPDLGTFSHVECMSVLEHCRRPWLMAENIERLIEPGGTLFVAAPFVWRIHAYPSDYWRMTPAALEVLFPRIAWKQRILGSHRLERGLKVRATKVGEYPYLPRTETLGFGVRT